LGLATFALALRSLPVDRNAQKADQAGFDSMGTLLLALTLAAYALAMTVGRGHFGPFNIALLSAAACGVVLFTLVERRTASPLLRLAEFRDPALGASLITSMLVATVMMATLVVGPFYLSKVFGLDAARVGLVVSVGPIVAALTGIPAGRIVDRVGARYTTTAGLIAIAAGSFVLSTLPMAAGMAGYIAPLVVITAGYALFQTGNNTSILADVSVDRRGAMSGMLNLSRNLGLITGASAMGGVFALGSGVTDIAAALPAAVANGMRTTFAVASALVVSAIILAIAGHALAWQRTARRTKRDDA